MAGDSEEAKHEKEDENGEESHEESLGSLFKDKKKKPINNGSLGARVKVAKVKKEEPQHESDELSIKKKRSKNAEKVKKETMKKNNEEEKRKAVAVEENGKKKEKKVFDFPGQKRDPPEERDPLRIFCESLYEQLPCNEMAQFWMMENGLLPIGVAKKVYVKKQNKKNQQQRLNSPIEAIASVKKTNQSVSVKKSTASPSSSAKTKTLESKKTVLNQSKKRKVGAEEDQSYDDDDFVALAKKKAKK